VSTCGVKRRSSVLLLSAVAIVAIVTLVFARINRNNESAWQPTWPASTAAGVQASVIMTPSPAALVTLDSGVSRGCKSDLALLYEIEGTRQRLVAILGADGTVLQPSRLKDLSVLGCARVGPAVRLSFPLPAGASGALRICYLADSTTPNPRLCVDLRVS
jgi:hypothetical protein